MSHERLARLMQAHRFSAALAPDERTRVTHESLLSIFSALDSREVTEGQVLRLLGFQALRWASEPATAALYREAAAAIRQMQREEH